MKLEQQLADVPLFNGLTSDQLQQAAAIAMTQNVSRGQTIFSEGDDCRGFYVVLEGQVKIFKLAMDGKEQILHIFGHGEPFAEVAVFTGTTYPANALALKKSRLCFFPCRAFTDMISQHPAMAMNMLAALSIRLKKFAHMIESLSLKEVPGRLATHLLLLSGEQDNSDTVELHIPKGQLASLLGTIPETLSRILSRMTSQGLIKGEGNTITLLDRQGLSLLASGEEKL